MLEETIVEDQTTMIHSSNSNHSLRNLMAEEEYMQDLLYTGSERVFIS